MSKSLTYLMRKEVAKMAKIKDIGDFIKAGFTKDDFIKLMANAREPQVENKNLQQVEVSGYKIDFSDPTKITLVKDNLTYQIKPLKDYRVDIAVYYQDKLCNREVLQLTSGKSRTTFVKNCRHLDEVLRNTLTAHLVEIPDVLDELNRTQLNEPEETEQQPTEGDITIAKKVLRSPTLLHDIIVVIKRTGVVGEEHNAAAHYLTFTSRLLDDPLSNVAKGESAVGKSYVLMQVMKLMPPGAYIDITDATPQSFYYAPKDYFAHRIIVIFEKHGGEKADYSIRSFQSEKKLKIQVPIKDPDTGQFVTKENVVDGPVGFITTTTDAQIHNENETRVLSLYPDESQEQTERIFDVINAKYQGNSGIPEAELNKWRNIQRILKPFKILIPFAQELSKLFPKRPTRVRRDYEKLLALISVITLLHQDQRQKETIGEQDYLQATLADFHIAKILFEGIFQKTIFEIPPKSQLLIDTAKEVVDGLIDKVTIRELADKLGWDYDTAKKWFDPAFRKGYFSIVDEHKGSKGATYKPTDKSLADKPILPSIEELYEINPDWLGNATIYDPLSGEVLLLQETDISTDVPIEDEQKQYNQSTLMEEQ